MEELLPGLFRLKIPLTENRLGYLNSYLFTSPERNLLIDTGLRQEACYDAMMGFLGEIGIDMRRTDIFLTHFHPDHGALTTQIVSPTTKVYLGAVEASILETNLSYDYLIQFMIRKGVPREEVPDIFLSTRFKNYLEAVMGQVILINDGDQICVGDYLFTAYMTPGHTDGHICLHDPHKKILISGDHVLDGITPGVECIYEDTDPLAAYYRSLNRIRSLEVRQVLPGHREPFTDCVKRIDEIKTHHDLRIEDMLDIMGEVPMDAYQIASQMKWQMGDDHWENAAKLHRWFATSETIAHLRYTEERGLVKKKADQNRDRYQLV